MPSSAETAEERRRSLDARLLRRRAERVSGARTGTIPRAPRTGPPPPSSGQRRFLLLNDLDTAGDSAAGTGNFAFWLRLRGDLDRDALGRALDELCRRHEVLRTVYGTEAGVPAQIVRDHTPAPLPVHDLSDAADPAGRARSLATARAREAFRLGSDTPFRRDLMRLGDRDHVLLLRIHHIAADGWSEGILNRELAALYGAFRRGEPSPLPPLPIQYADFAAWQQEQLARGALDAETEHWAALLDGPPAATELPFDRPPTATSGAAGTVLRLPVDRSAHDRITALCTEHGVSLFHALLGGYAALLTRRSGQTDLVIGAPVANRPHAETAGLIGFFVNTVALRVDTSGNPTFGELLRRVKDVALDAADHQTAPFEQVVRRVAPPREPGRQPLVQTMLQVHNTPQDPLVLDGLDVEHEQLFTDSTSADLSVSFVETDGELEALWEYRTELFDPATVRRLHQDLVALTGSAAAEPGVGIAELDILPAAEREWLRHRSRGPRRPPPDGVPALFAAQVRRTPKAPAVVCGADTLTYTELADRADTLARHLAGLGVGAGDLVGICLERGADLVVSVLAVLGAGAAYLPLDPGYPAGRLRFMVRDAKPALVLTHAATAGVPDGVRTERVDLVRERPEGRPGRVPLEFPGAQDLAYVIYTSGSTGTPKGVAVPHGGLANYLAWAGDRYRTTPGGGSVLHSSLSFDLTVTSLFLPLLSGEPVIAVPDEQPLPRLAALLTDARREPAMVKLTPSHLRALRGEAAASGPADAVAAFVIGGEVLPADLVAVWRLLAPRARFFNEYGPTEAVVGCCVHEAAGGPGGGAAVPIGTPVDNTELYVLDRAGNQVRPGAIGELYIGGSQVVRGYLNRPALTAERFVPDPFGGEPGSRLYRTGDLVRYLPDGALELIGRTDDQVKVRGQRVETGEVEFALRRCPGVADAVVVAGGPPGAAALVGYYVADAGAAPAPDGLRDALALTLPRHMVPAVLMPLGAMPLTENGKVDRAALPDPADVARRSPRTGGAAPADAVEERLAGIWARTLGCERVGVLDDFFELGGHSLLAAEVIEHIGRAWPAIPVRGMLREIFLHPTVRALAAAVRTALATAGPGPADTAAVHARPARPGPLPLSPGQESLLVQVELSGSPHEYLVPQALRLDGPLDVTALRRALTAISDRHEVLRSRFPRDAGDHCYALPLGREPAFAEHDLRHLPAAERPDAVAALLRAEVTTPLDLTAGPLLRALLIRDRDDSRLLCLTTHHLVFDGRSQQILFSSLIDGYTRALSAGTPPPPGSSPQYADLVGALREQAENPADEDVAYWREALAGTPVLALPTDRPRDAARAGTGRAVVFRVGPRTVAALRRLAKDRSATLFMTLLAGLQCVLSRHTGQEDFAVGTSVAGRGVPGSGDLIGLFINQVALRADLSGDPAFGDVVGRVRQRCADAFARSDVPFDRVVREVRPERVAGANPLFQVAFELAGAPWSGETETGLRLREHPVPVTVSKFDLTVAFRPDGDHLLGEVEYDMALFDEQRVRGLADDLVQVLDAAAADPAKPVGALLPEAAPTPTPYGGDDPAGEPAHAEPLVADAYRAVLPETAFGPDDDFFALGGHSVLALRVVSRLRKALDLDIPLDLIFQYPTVRTLAGQLEALLLAEIEALPEHEAAEALADDAP
ncbi:amino acid adenylation domain-containing protein [Streptomyces castrisilvae]|uniref:Amino acid adenylation domain-containing protein n=1 Tax=Streptomyces castrisilvae TaxID=3033811 RepID=A0ABY9HCM8_9ACTN|nr:non-ribosomal peptide synthetase [Streptomyces sp. Mut1]WLQ32271.1 amino acid adenylation domain-containing protein [Streptomyces sp. Mut1]